MQFVICSLFQRHLLPASFPDGLGIRFIQDNGTCVSNYKGPCLIWNLNTVFTAVWTLVSHSWLILSSALYFLLATGKFYEYGSMCLDIVLPHKDIFDCSVGFWWWCMTFELIGFMDFFLRMCRNLTHCAGDCVKFQYMWWDKVCKVSGFIYISDCFCSNNKLDALKYVFLQFMTQLFDYN